MCRSLTKEKSMKKILWVLAMFFAFTGLAFAAVNLNTATKEELDAVKGIGPAKAQAIIDYRSKNGPFKSVDDLKNVHGFGDKTVAKMRSELSVSGATTVPAAKEEKKAEPAKDAKADKKAAREAKKAEKAAKAEEMKKEPAKEEKKAEAKKDSKADKKAAKEAKKAEKAAKKEAAKKAEAEKK
jgi:competence protein ComEA